MEMAFFSIIYVFLINLSKTEFNFYRTENPDNISLSLAKIYGETRSEKAEREKIEKVNKEKIEKRNVVRERIIELEKKRKEKVVSDDERKVKCVKKKKKEKKEEKKCERLDQA